MSRAHPRSVWTRLAALFVAVAAAAQPVLAASFRPGASRVEDEGSSCCASRAGCCGAEESGTPVPSYDPSCCGLGEQPSRPPEPEHAPRLAVPDPLRRVLGEVTRGCSLPAFLPASDAELHHGFRGLRPAATCEPPASGDELHGWTNRGAPAALALLSILRL